VALVCSDSAYMAPCTCRKQMPAGPVTGCCGGCQLLLRTSVSSLRGDAAECESSHAVCDHHHHEARSCDGCARQTSSHSLFTHSAACRAVFAGSCSMPQLLLSYRVRWTRSAVLVSGVQGLPGGGSCLQLAALLASQQHRARQHQLTPKNLKHTGQMSPAGTVNCCS
jgi:hypothetical protein